MPLRRLIPALCACWACLALGPAPASGQAETARQAPMDPSHLALLRRVASPELSPDGRWLAFVVERPARDGESAVAEIRVTGLAERRVLEVGEGERPRFAPDGRRLAYLADRDGETGIWLYDLEAGTSERLAAVHRTSHFLGHEAERGFAWSPDGKAIAFLGAEGPAPPAPGIRVISRLLYKTRTGFSDDRRTHLWVVPAVGEDRGKARLLTPGDHDEHSLSWSPDGRSLAFLSNRAAEPDDRNADDLFVVEVAGGALRRLTETAGTEMHPAFSPDGTRIAYLATRLPVNTRDSPAEDPRLFVIAAGGGTPVDLAPSLDRRIDELLWLPDGKSLLVTALDEGSTPILRVPTGPPEAPAAGKIERFLDGFFRATDLSLDRSGATLAYVRSTFAEPGEVVLSQVASKGSRRVTSENRRAANRLELRDADSFTFESFDGQRVQGWVMKPAGFRPDARYPAILWVHGGPHGMFGHMFSERLQVMAGGGYGLILINPRGSAGYGQAFTDGTKNDWGGGDYRDLMLGVDAALARFPWIDGNRLGVAGSSYGGYMTGWIVTHTDRFKAAVAIAALTNLVSFYGTSLYQDLLEVEFGGRPWEGEHFARLWQCSPLAHVVQAKTPTLFLHGEADHDVPITQAEELYMGLKKRGITTELVRYPGEGHSLRKPNHQRDALERTRAWFDRYLKPAP